jgi:hypothetical protein
MNAAEATQLLTLIAAAEGRSEVNPAQALSWSFALDDIPAEIAQAALRDAFHVGDAYRITPQTLRRHAAPLMRRVAADVRSAKLRGLIPDAWPETRPIPSEAADRLRAEFDSTNDRPELGAADTNPRELRP